MVARRRTLDTQDEVREAVDGLLMSFGVLDDAIISAGDTLERKLRARLKDGGHGKGAGSASADALWSKKRR